jgi:hypothetical protein
MEPDFKKKILLLSLAIFIAFSALSAETFIASGHDHECTGENCQVCLRIEIVKCFLRIFNLAGLVVFFAAIRAFFALVYRAYNEFSYYVFSPVMLKVRFNT